MITIGKKNNFPRNFLLSEKILTAFLLGIIILLSIPLYDNYHRRQKINTEISDLETEIKQTENKNSELQQLIKYLESDQFVEEQARLNLNMKKPGESVAVVKDALAGGKETGADQIVSSTLTGAAGKGGYFTNWWNYFFK